MQELNARVDIDKQKPEDGRQGVPPVRRVRPEELADGRGAPSGGGRSTARGSARRPAGGRLAFERVAVVTDTLEVRLLRPDARAPARTRAGDAGYDLCAVEPFSLAPGERAVVPTGVAIAVPEGAAGLVVPALRAGGQARPVGASTARA